MTLMIRDVFHKIAIIYIIVIVFVCCPEKILRVFGLGKKI